MKLNYIIKTIDENIKTVVASGYSNDDVITDYKDYNFDEMVKKKNLFFKRSGKNFK